MKKNKKITNMKEAKLELKRRLEEQANKERKAEFKARLDEVKKLGEQAKQGAMNAKDKFSYRLKNKVKKGLEKKNLSYSNFDAVSQQLLTGYVNDLDREINKRFDDIMERFEGNLKKVLENVEELEVIKTGSEWMSLPMEKVKLKRLNELGEQGWEFAFFVDGQYFSGGVAKLYLSRKINIKVK